MPVRHFQHFGVADVDLFLARAPFALGVLDRDAGRLHLVAQPAHHALFLGGDADQVVADIGRGGLQALPVLFAGGIVGFLEQVELEFGGEVGKVATLLQPRHLLAQNRARRMRQVLVRMVVLDVVEDERRLLQPGHRADGGEVRLHDEVAVALRPARRLVAGHRLHIDVVGEQVVAAVRLVIGALDEELRQEPLADQPALHVDRGSENGVDLAVRNRLLQLIECEISGHYPLSPDAPGPFSKWWTGSRTDPSFLLR